jgi:hypothetical protein
MIGSHEAPLPKRWGTAMTFKLRVFKRSVATLRQEAIHKAKMAALSERKRIRIEIARNRELSGRAPRESLLDVLGPVTPSMGPKVDRKE